MTSLLIPKHSSTHLVEQKDHRGLEQSPDPISLNQTYPNSQGLNRYHNSDPALSIDLPSWNTLCVSAEQSEPSSDIDQLDETNFNPHPLNNSSSSPKFKQIPTDLHGDTATTEKTPPSDNHAEHQCQTDMEQPTLHLHTRASSSTATARTTLPPHPPSVGPKYSTPPTSHTSATGTRASQIACSNLKPGPPRSRSSFIGVVITRPPPQRQMVTQKPSRPVTFQGKSHPTPDVDSGAPPSIPNSSKPLKAQGVNPEEEEESSPTPSTPSIRSPHEVGPLRSASSPGTPSLSPVLLAPSSPSEQGVGTEKDGIQGPLVKTRDSLPNDESFEVPLVQAEGDAPTTSLADALTSAFTKNAYETQLDDFRPERRHPPLMIKIVPMNASSSSSSMYARTQIEQRQSYIRKSKVPYLYGEKEKGRVLDENEYAELLSADVVDVAFGARLEAVNIDHVRRSNLRHLPANAQPGQAEADANLLDGPTPVPPRFAKHMVSRDDNFLDMLERTFGPDSHWGGGPKPKLVMKFPSSEDSRAASPSVQNSYESDEAPTPGLGLRKRRALDIAPNGDAREAKRSRIEDPETTSIPRPLVANWVVLLQGLVKGKAKMHRGQVAFLSRLLNTIEKVKESVSFDVVLNSKIRQTMRQVSELAIEDIPFEDEHDLRGRAGAVASFWSLKWSNEVESD